MLKPFLAIWRAILIARRLRLERAVERLDAQIEAQEVESRRYARKTLYSALGLMTHSWAGLEIVLDISNVAIMHALPNPEPFPVSLSRKLRFFRKGHNQLPALAQYRQAGTEIADEIQRLSAKRHDLVHGFAMDALSSEGVRLYRHTVSTDPALSHLVSAKRTNYTFDDVWSVADDAATVGERLIPHAVRLLAATGSSDKFDDLARQFSIGSE